jgi:hypothetical protein
MPQPTSTDNYTPVVLLKFDAQLKGQPCVPRGADELAHVKTAEPVLSGDQILDQGELSVATAASMIRSAHRTASAIALIVAGTLPLLSNCASFLAARIEAMIAMTALREIISTIPTPATMATIAAMQ